MYKIDLEIKALSPLAIGYQKPSSSISQALDYIPGTVIRGAIASLIMQFSDTPNPDENDDFYKLFTSENAAIFQNAYPANLNLKSKNYSINDVYVIPATALSSKNNSGFKNINEKGNGVFDTLIDRFWSEKSQYPYDPNCPKDGGRVDAFSGFYCEYKGRPYSLKASKRLLTRTGINRKRATTEESILYSIEVLNESSQNESKGKPAIYRGTILLNDKRLANDLVAFIEHYSELIRIGGSKSRGLGKVSINPKLQEIESDLDSRLDKFNQKLRDRWNQWKIFNPSSPEITTEQTFFTINLQSDAILQENWLRTTILSKDMLQSISGVEDATLTLETAYTSYDYISGWNSAWGLMKDVELITQKGGVYLFSTQKKDLWIEPLKQLEIKGIGERTTEGFGQVQICSPFHLILREESV